MTHDEIKEASYKFCQYLEANNVRVASMTIGLADGVNLYFGESDMLVESLLTIVAQQNGFVLGRRP